METSTHALEYIVKNGVVPLHLTRNQSVPVSLRETLIVDEPTSTDRENNAHFPSTLPARDELLLKALKLQLENTIIGRHMNCQVQYLAPPVTATWRGTTYGTTVVEIPYTTAKLTYTHTEQSAETRIQALQRRLNNYPLKNAVSLQNAIVFFMEPGKAIFRLTSNAMEIGAKVATQNAGQSKEVRLPSHTYGGIRFVNLPQNSYDQIETGIQILLPPNHNGIYNPIFDDKKGEVRYMHVWEHLPGLTYSRAMPFHVELLPR